MKQMPPAGQFLPYRQAQLFEAQPAPVRHAFIGMHGPDRTPTDSRRKRDRLIGDDDAGEHAAVGTERPHALHLEALWTEVDDVDRAPGTERGLRHAQRVAWEPRFPPAIRQGVIHCPVPG